MSWNEYVQSLISAHCSSADTSKDEPQIAEAAICGREDGSVWAASPMFKGITPDEIKAVLKVSEGPENGSMVTLAGVKAMVLKWELHQDNILTMTTVKNTEMDESRLLVVGFGNKALVIGLSKPGYRSVAVHVGKMTEYLKNLGY